MLMETNQLIAIIALATFGLGFGTLTARVSQSRQQIHGGTIAKAFHYLACSIMTALTPTLLTSIFVFHLGFVRAVLVVLVLFVLAIALLLPYAVVENPAQVAYEKSKEERGWTAEDALRSGL